MSKEHLNLIEKNETLFLSVKEMFNVRGGDGTGNGDENIPPPPPPDPPIGG